MTLNCLSFALSNGGRYVTVGGDLNRLLQVVLFKGIFSKFYKKTIDVVGLKANKGLTVIEEFYQEGKIVPVIDGPHKLCDVPSLIQYFGEGRHYGKIVLSL